MYKFHHHIESIHHNELRDKRAPWQRIWISPGDFNCTSSDVCFRRVKRHPPTHPSDGDDPVSINPDRDSPAGEIIRVDYPESALPQISGGQDKRAGGGKPWKMMSPKTNLTFILDCVGGRAGSLCRVRLTAPQVTAPTYKPLPITIAMCALSL